MDAVSDFLIAPVQPWDALICTSEAVKRGIEQLLDRWGAYLQHRLGGTPQATLQLPVIPLGVDTTACLQGDAAESARQRWRSQWDADEDTLVVLFVGRLISYAKAHPVPMYLALERAAQRTGKSVVLVQAGWFEAEHDEQAFREGAKLHCPSVKAVFLDGRLPEVRQQIWSAADVFISLADNIQETFGLTPIEAMAAGLPVVVSDWNGYRESVRHEVDGFRVPTTLPPQGTGADLAYDYFSDRTPYGSYVGESSILIAVDVAACATYLERLFESPELRRQLGANGRQRARSQYDWRVVVAAYEELWLDLARRRASEAMCAPVRESNSPHPIQDDPFRAFAHYATRSLSPQMRLRLGQMAGATERDRLFALWFDRVGGQRRLSLAEIDKVVAWIGQHEPVTVSDLFDALQVAPQSPTGLRLSRTLTYLLKFDVLALV
jgi:glycosyltransferase involved in cell wall biosynthesis